MKWVITGGCGFIGTGLIRKLKEHSEHSIRVIDNLAVGTKAKLKDIAETIETGGCDVGPMKSMPNQCAIELVVGDILDVQLAILACKGADVIVHLAANTGVGPSVENPRLDCMTNVVGTLNYLEAARIHKIPRFVFASSGAPVGEVEPPIHEELPPHPVSPYAASKLAGEGYCSAYNRTFYVETVALRFGNVYGPGSDQKSSVIAKFINYAMRGQRFEIFGDGRQTRDFIYIDDLVEALIQAAKVRNIGGEIFQVATNKETRIDQLVAQLASVLKEYGITCDNPIYGEKRRGDVSKNFSDISKAKKLLNWTPETDLDSGLRKTINWFLTLTA